jgi:outer membrane receptor for ferrienterochelin and colicins
MKIQFRSIGITSLTLLSLSWLTPALQAAGEQEAGPGPTDLSIEELLDIQVEGAALHAQSLKDAPASVTIITQDDIRRFGYHTLAEALSDARGFFTTYDHIYHFQSVRGFGLPGDYGTRLLLLVNGHNMTDNLLGQSVWFGQDFPVDMSLIKRIEVIRGPASALYGSSGVFATINVVTLSPDEFKSAQLRTETGTLGEKKIQGAASFALGHRARVLLSGSILRNRGERSIYVPEYDDASTNFGRAVGVDGERGYHVFGNLAWRDWNISGLLGGRDKTQVISWGQTVFNDPATRSSDAPNFVDATYAHNFSSERSVHWRTYYDSYRFRGTFRYPEGDGTVDDMENFSGDWAGSQLDYRAAVPYIGFLTLGGVGQFDIRADMRQDDLMPVYQEVTNVDSRDRSAAVFVQDEWTSADKHWKIDLGTRVDFSRSRHHLSPRVALIYSSNQTSYKLLYGKAFRSPTAFELFYTDLEAQTIGNPDARPESSNTQEFIVERKVGRRLNGILSVYRYRVDDLLVAEYTGEGLLQYRNASEVDAHGIEMELNGHPWRELEVVGSLALQRALNIVKDQALPNSPHQLAKFRVAVPLFDGRLSMASSTQYIGTRQSLAGATLPAVVLSDIVFSSNRLTPSVDFQLGVRNVGNVRLLNPIALNSRVDTLTSSGRSMFASFTWRTK